MSAVARSAILGCAAALLVACAAGPAYVRPTVDAVAHFREGEGWKPSEPADVLSRGPWWEIFGDPVLNDLEQRIAISNHTVRAAAASAEQARALVSQARSAFWPGINVTGQRSRTTTNPDGGSPVHRTQNEVGVGATWNLDVWGQIRRSSEGQQANYQASEAALAAARLSAQTQLAVTYFELRAQDRLQGLLGDIVRGQQESLRIAESRFRFGVVAKADVVSARTQLLTSQAQQLTASIQRALYEHALAVLTGRPPADFTLDVAALRADVPTVPPGLPAALLERRPDIAAAERRVAASSAQIGVARAAFFPAVSLTANADYTGSALSGLMRASNRVWAFGPALALNLFDGGLRRAQVRAARAAFDVSVEDYRQTVLAAFQQVEDELVILRVLEKQAAISEQAVAAAREAETLTLEQYKGGTVPYNSVIVAQAARLNSEQSALNVLLNRLTASITMIEALGGGWSAVAGE